MKEDPLSACQHPICSQTFLCASIAPPTNHSHRSYCILGNHVLIYDIIHHLSQPPNHPLDKLIKCKLHLLPPHIIQTIAWYIKGKSSRSVVSDSATPWTVAYQAPSPMGFSRQEYWNGLPFPSPGDLPDPGIKPGSPEFQADALTSEPPSQ